VGLLDLLLLYFLALPYFLELLEDLVGQLLLWLQQHL
jgi:hypothetical protein